MCFMASFSVTATVIFRYCNFNKYHKEHALMSTYIVLYVYCAFQRLSKLSASIRILSDICISFLDFNFLLSNIIDRYMCIFILVYKVAPTITKNKISSLPFGQTLLFSYKTF